MYLLQTSDRCLWLQYYLSKFIPVHFRKSINKIRLSFHNLAIESGRYHNIDRSNERTCISCVNEIECEIHFIMVCPLYSKFRKLYIKPYCWRKPSVYKLINLLNVRSIKQLRNLGKYPYYAMNLRSSCI